MLERRIPAFGLAPPSACAKAIAVAQAAMRRACRQAGRRCRQAESRQKKESSI